MSSASTAGWTIFGLGNLVFAIFCIRLIPQIKGGKQHVYTIHRCICRHRAPSLTLNAGYNGAGYLGFFILYALIAILPGLWAGNQFTLSQVPWYFWLGLGVYLSMGILAAAKYSKAGHTVFCSLRRGILGLLWFSHSKHNG